MQSPPNLDFDWVRVCFLKSNTSSFVFWFFSYRRFCPHHFTKLCASSDTQPPISCWYNFYRWQDSEQFLMSYEGALWCSSWGSPWSRSPVDDPPACPVGGDSHSVSSLLQVDVAQPLHGGVSWPAFPVTSSRVKLNPPAYVLSEGCCLAQEPHMLLSTLQEQSFGSDSRWERAGRPDM